MFDTLFFFASAQAKKTTYTANLLTAQAICTCVKERRRKVLRRVSRTLTQVQTSLKIYHNFYKKLFTNPSRNEERTQIVEKKLGEDTRNSKNTGTICY
jgi:hypothetical protein